MDIEKIETDQAGIANRAKEIINNFMLLELKEFPEVGMATMAFISYDAYKQFKENRDGSKARD